MDASAIFSPPLSAPREGAEKENTTPGGANQSRENLLAALADPSTMRGNRRRGTVNSMVLLDTPEEGSAGDTGTPDARSASGRQSEPRPLREVPGSKRFSASTAISPSVVSQLLVNLLHKLPLDLVIREPLWKR